MELPLEKATYKTIREEIRVIMLAIICKSEFMEFLLYLFFIFLSHTFIKTKPKETKREIVLLILSIWIASSFVKNEFLFSSLKTEL